MSFVTYSGMRLRPISTMGIQESIEDTPGGRLGSIYTITLQGHILADRGSPNSQGIFAVGNTNLADETIVEDQFLASYERKIEAVKKLFSNDGLELKILSEGTESAFITTPLICYPKVKSIDFPEGQYVIESPYTLVFETNYISGYSTLQETPPSQFITSANESWDISEGDTAHTFKFTHNISAVGSRTYSSAGTITTPAWQQAQRYVNSRLGYQQSDIIATAALSGITTNLFNINALSGYNLQRVEQKDYQNGNYSIQETWTLATGVAIENYDIKLNRHYSNSKVVNELSLDGTIRGLYSAQNDYETGFNNAKTYLTNNQAGFLGRTYSYYSGLNLIDSTINYIPNQALINYSFSYNDLPVFSGAAEEYTVQSKYNPQDYKTTITVAGHIEGRLSLGETDYTLKYPRAKRRWDVFVKPDLYNRALIYASGIHDGPGLLVNLQSGAIDRNFNADPYAGSIDYSFSFNNRNVNFSDEEFSVSRHFSRDQGNIVTVQGVIQGYDNLSNSGILTTRIGNAELAFPTDANMYTRITTYQTGIYVNQTPFTRDVTRAVSLGRIEYSYQYDAKPQPLFANAIFENITVNDVNSCKVVAQIPVLGRTFGPVLQDVLVGTARNRQISIELVFPASTGVSYLQLYNNKPNTDTILTALAPTGIQTYKVEDQESWQIQTARYSRNANYLYEP